MKRLCKYMKKVVPFCLFLVALLSSGVAMAQEEVVAEAATVVSEEAEAGFSINAVDTIWVLLAAMLVFFMQPGFALVEDKYFPLLSGPYQNPHQVLSAVQ